MLLVLVYIGVLASWEEFIFRGAMLKNLAEGADGYVPQWAAAGLAIVVSTVIFALLHGGKISDPLAYGYYMVAGLIAFALVVFASYLGTKLALRSYFEGERPFRAIEDERR